MKIILTNDDGIEADGLAALEEVVIRVFPGAEVWVVAPDRGRSQCSHAVTTYEPIRTEPKGERRFAVSGFPADCVRVALFGLNIEADWVFSGINHGGNMGQDIAFSGTVAAAREAAYHGVSACAISQYMESDGFQPDSAVKHGLSALKSITPVEAGSVFWNINLPPRATASGEVVNCHPERHPLPADYHRETNGRSMEFRYNGKYHERGRNSESDVGVCFGGDIAISQVSIV